MAAAVTLALSLLLVGSLLVALVAPPPTRRVDVRVRGGMITAGLLCYLVAAIALTADSVVGGVVALALASELLCAAGWLGRGDSPDTDDDEGGGGGGGGGRGPKSPPPLDWDWDSFESGFRRYARERDGQPV